MEVVCGIYKIENLINHKSYIGQSVDIYGRWYDHKWELNNNKHKNQHLLRSWNKYGYENFEFTIIEECDKSKLNEREIYWIDYYKSFDIGYNQTKGGDGCTGKIWTEEEISNINISRPVLQINLDGKIINRFVSINDAEKHTGINRRGIWNCTNKYFHTYKRDDKIYEHFSKTYGGYIWVYEDDYDNFDLSFYKSKLIKNFVYQYDLNWNLIKSWESAESTKIHGYDPTVIRRACQGDNMTAYGFLWSYEVKNLDEYIIWFNEHFNVKYIAQYDLNDNLKKVWNTAKETEQDGFCACSVRECAKGNQSTHKGYIFKYITWKELKITNWKGKLNYGK